MSSEKISAEIEIPEQWHSLPLSEMNGTLLVVGASDTGKTTLVRYLVKKQIGRGRKVGWIDADPGQSSLGMPGTLNLAFPENSAIEWPEPAATFFVGNTSPRGHMLPMLAGLRRLQEFAQDRHCEVLIIDTSGLVAQKAGGGALKEWEIELLRPQSLIALQRSCELEHILAPLRNEHRLQLYILPVSAKVERRNFDERRSWRKKQFRSYFAEAQPLQFFRQKLPVYGLDRARTGQVMAFIDGNDLALELGVMQTREGDGYEVITPMKDLQGVCAIRFGALTINPKTGEELMKIF